VLVANSAIERGCPPSRLPKYNREATARPPRGLRWSQWREIRAYRRPFTPKPRTSLFSLASNRYEQAKPSTPARHTQRNCPDPASSRLASKAPAGSAGIARPAARANHTISRARIAAARVPVLGRSGHSGGSREFAMSPSGVRGRTVEPVTEEDF
jgi:hypothetical protein